MLLSHAGGAHLRLTCKGAVAVLDGAVLLGVLEHLSKAIVGGGALGSVEHGLEGHLDGRNRWRCTLIIVEDRGRERRRFG